MEKIKVEREAFVLDKGEKTKLKECLVYCRHRLTQHPGNGLARMGVDVKYMDYMINNI